MSTSRSRRIPASMARRSGAARGGGRRLWIAPAAALALLAAGACVMLLTGLFEIDEIRVHGSRNLPLESLEGQASVYVGANVFTVPLSKIREILKSDPSVGSVTFRRRLPHRLDCYLRGREPVALLNIDGMAEVDGEGTVIPAGDRSMDIDLPLITGLGTEEIDGDEGKEMVGRALEVLALLKEFGFSPARQLSEIHIDGGEIVLVWMDSGTLVRVGRDSFEERIRKFRAVFPSLREKGGLPSRIDLRFDRQVVVR
jgi:cell division septal protein FtsQ